jgi:putative DNA primase/helicase
MSPRNFDKAVVEQAMIGRAAQIAQHILGQPRRKQGREMFFGEKRGSLGVAVSGPKEGAWFDHATREHGDLFQLIQTVEGVTFPEAIRRAAEIIGLSAPHAPRPADRREWQRKQDERAREQATADAADRARKSEVALALWARGFDPCGTVVETYLVQARKVPLPDAVAYHAIRYVPDYQWFDQATEQTYNVPVMLGLMRDIQTDEPMAVHRTALKEDGSGKAPLLNAKKMLGPAGGAAIKLCPGSGITHGLTIAEGIESGLAAWRIGFCNVWALGSSGAIRTFPILRGVDGLAVAGEDDAANDLAFAEVAARYYAAGIGTVRIKSPVGGDLADMAAKMGDLT